MKFLDFACEFKATDTGEFAGYASVFGNIDLGGDIVERGAFKEIVKNAAGQVTVLWQHIARSPIGVATVKQDDKGLAFEGSLVLEDPQARVARAHMKAGSVRGMSIGYDVREGGAKILESGIRQLTDLKLWEISAVTWGMNPLAGVTDVKASQQITNVREFEDFLREAGFSRAQAKQLAVGGWTRLDGRREADGDLDAKALADFIANL
jgi:HK97 family phage prohead protease